MPKLRGAHLWTGRFIIQATAVESSEKHDAQRDGELNQGVLAGTPRQGIRIAINTNCIRKIFN